MVNKIIKYNIQGTIKIFLRGCSENQDQLFCLFELKSLSTLATGVSDVYQQDHRSGSLLKHFIDFCGMLTTGLTRFHFEWKIHFGCFKPGIAREKLVQYRKRSLPPPPLS